MQFRLKKTITRVTMLTALVPTLSLLAADALAHKPVPPSPKRDPATSAQRGDYAYDAYGRNVRSGYGECVVDGWWTPATATIECHPEMFAEPAKRAAAPEPKPEPKAVEVPPAPIVYEAETPDPYAQQAAAGEEFKGFPAAAEEERDLGPDFYAPGDDPNLVPVPLAAAGDEADDKLGEPRMFYDEEEGVAQDDGIIATSRYYEEEGEARDDGIVSRSQYYDEEELSTGDDGILAYRRDFDEEEGVERDDGILARNQYYDEEEGAAGDEGILARSEYHEEEEGVERDDGILARSEYHEEEQGAAPEEGIVGRSQYYEEEGKEAADAIGAPKAFQEEQVAAAEEKAPEPKPTPKAEPEPTPAPKVEPEPEPKPAPKAEPKPEPKPVVLPITITVEADALFDFDRSNVRSDARAKLDKLVDDLQGVKYEEILVVGHADRIGTVKYNQRLSERRANAVKNYLVGKGLPADTIKTDARGELEAETPPEQCAGLRKGKLIACLQPDRRAEVTVTGQK